MKKRLKIMLDFLCRSIHRTAASKGFWDDKADIHFMLSKLALIHSEVSETLEAIRKEMGPAKIEEELADILIRVLDFVEGAKVTGWLDPKVFFEDTVRLKMEKNEKRPEKHGNLA